jgi:hypothetical protein
LCRDTSYIYVERATFETYLGGEDRTPAETEVNNPLQNAISREAKDDEARARWASHVAELDELRTKLAQFEKKPLAAVTKERNTLLKLVIGMAIAAYRYDPTTRGAIPKEIVGDLDELGIWIDEDTVRTWLKKGYDEFGDATMRKRLNEKFKKSLD